jgi:dipeptidyl aminopeptidase/acylaminoacyl peptidase
MNDEHVKILNDWSSDGKYIVYTRQSPQSGMDLWVVEVATGVSRPLIATTHSETQARLSPDGKWIAWTSDESGRLEIYVAGFPTLEHKTRISSNGGGQPQWRSDQKELFYLALDQAIMASVVDGKPTPSFAAPRALFRTPITGSPGNAREHYAVNASGTRFLMDANVDAQRTPEISIMVNWASRLRGEGPNLAQASLAR